MTEQETVQSAQARIIEAQGVVIENLKEQLRAVSDDGESLRKMLFLLMTPTPDGPCFCDYAFRRGNVLWKTHTKECREVSSFVNNYFPKMGFSPDDDNSPGPV